MTAAVIEISIYNLALGYLLLLIPIGLAIYLGINILATTIISVLRMTFQLLFVGFYLHIVFERNLWWLNLLWLLLMLIVADLTVIKGTKLALKKFILPLFPAILVGTSLPLLYFTGIILRLPNLLEAQYFIPIGGMIMGNCLRADIIGISNFYQSIRKNEKNYLYNLALGATLWESVTPYLRQAYYQSLAPTIATLATIGLVSLPGMMTGIIMAGANPMTAIKYQIAIMLAIFVSTAITVFITLLLTIKANFNQYGIMDEQVFRD